jgi:DNA-binding CsgD family transcriptional regulator
MKSIGIDQNRLLSDIARLKGLVKQLGEFIGFSHEGSILNKLKFFLTCFCLTTENPSKKISRESFSPKEKECAYYLLKGMTAKEIGQAMDISSRTVECHIARMRDKLGCFSKSQLVNKLFSFFKDILE